MIDMKMFAPLLAIAVLLLGDAEAQVQVAVTTPDDALITPMPKIDARQVLLAYGHPRLLGWQASGGSIYQRTCVSGLSYSVRSPYYACCPTSTNTCSFVDRCEGLYTQVFPGDRSSRCSTACVTGRLFWSTADTNPFTYLGCGTTDYFIVQSSDSSGVLEFNPGIATGPASKTTTTDVLTPVVPTNSLTVTDPSITPTSSEASPATTTQTTPVPAPAKSANTGAIIGGAVGGGAVAIGLITLGLLLFFRRRRSHTANPNPNPPMQQYASPISYAQSGSPPPPFSPGQGGFLYSPVSGKDGVDGSGRPFSMGSGEGTVVSEVSGTPVGHAMELGGSPVVQGRP
ncbi:hypothetical protein BJ875DRAFT_451198 [Amylocarpus encephaloides]|uniref:WSC domain-containing protein n=1 Tax=Amylocarpus encephaloides TaxID=45428 RepID=A0A9P8C9H3_9HELO|nr:hypothetical protein BJ875DRAFT_451198 [Amylocarpus encephaloides]